MVKMKNQQSNIYPKIVNVYWWILAICIFSLCIYGTYFLSQRVIYQTQKELLVKTQLIGLIYSDLEKSASSDKKTSRLTNLDSIIIARDYQFKVFHVLGLDENKTRVVNSYNDSTIIGKPYDLSKNIQNVFLDGTSNFELLNLFSFNPELYVFTGNPKSSTQQNHIFTSSILLRELVFVFYAGMFISFMIPILIIILAGKSRKKIIIQKQQFLEQLMFALEKSDYEKVKFLLGSNDGLLFHIKDLEDNISELQDKEMSYRESLQVQIKKMVELIEPLTKGNWGLTIEVPPGMLTPIAESINLIVNQAKGSPPTVTTDKLEKDEKAEVMEASTPEVAVPMETNFPDINSWTEAITGSGEDLDYMISQLELITKALPPMFIQIEDLYESQLNHTLFTGERKDLKSLRMLEILISEKSSTILTLKNLTKTVNEIVMLKNWINHKRSIKDNELSSISS